MPRRKILMADLLCGAGGSTTGALRALTDLGFAASDIVVTCVNHWPTAIETHTKNHPEARHYCQDISTVRPHLVVPEGYLDLLMASPTCTHHSVARGGKPTSDQQRSDPWHIITWLTELRVKRMIIENVWEFCQWGPVDPRTGKPIQSRKGEYFRAWVDTIRRFGYDPEWRKLNAADYGEAQTRERFILMARSDRRSISWPTPSHMKLSGQQISLLPSVERWRPSREVIDWSIKGKSIYRRKKPLAPKTLARIEAGMVKFKWPEPFLVVLRNHMAGRSLDEPLPTIAANGQHIGLVQPFVFAPGSTGAPRTTEEPLPTITTGGAGSAERHGCARPMLIEPLIAPYYGSGSGTTCTDTNDPLPTITSKGRFGIVIPVTHSDGSQRARDVNNDPLPTLTTANRGELAIVEGIEQCHDVLFRMLEPHELAAGQGFTIEEAKYEFAGTKTEQIKQIGNAVSVRKMKACVKALMADAAPKQRAANQAVPEQEVA